MVSPRTPRETPRKSSSSYHAFHGIPRGTPIVELKSLSEELGCVILAKCEHLHPGGSVKDRAAHALVDHAIASGELKPGGTIVQGTGGNTGVSLAMIAKSRGYKAHVCIPENISPDKVDLLRMLGAEVTVCPCVPYTDPRSYMSMAASIAASTPGAAKPCQFECIANADAHYKGTGAEIWAQTAGDVDGFVCAAGTGGTIGGVTRYLKEKRGDAIQTYLIDPTGSGLKCFVETGAFASAGGCFIDGIGIGRETANFRSARVDGAFRGTDGEAIEMAYYLLRNEGIFVGPSAALNVVGAVKLARKLGVGSGKTVVTILCDGGERYRATTFNPEWLREKNLTPTATGTSLDFVRPSVHERERMRVAVHARAIDVALDALPSEWLGTTFRNENLLGREAFASALNDLVCGIVESGASEVTTSALEALGVAEDYLRVASNLSVFLELELARVAGHGDVRRVFSFASEDAPASCALLSTPAKRVTFYLGVGKLWGNEKIATLSAFTGRTIVVKRGVPTSACRDDDDDDDCVMMVRAGVGVGDGPCDAAFLRAAAAAGVAGVVDGSDLHVLDQSKLPPEAVATARKRAATPATHALALFKLRSMTPNPPPPFVDAAGRSTSLTRASPSEIDGMQTHLQRLHGVDEGDFRARAFPPPEHLPNVFSAGLPALATMFGALAKDGGVDVVMASTAYGGSSQLVDLLRERTRGRVRKWSFDVQGPDADVVANLSSTLDALARTKETLAVTGEREGGEEEEEGAEKEKRGREIDGAWTVVFVEIPTNPDMKVPSLPALVDAVRAYEHASRYAPDARWHRVVVLVDTTFAPGSEVLGKLRALAPEMIAVAFCSLSKSFSRGKVTAGALVVGDADAATPLHEAIGSAMEIFGTRAGDDQLEALCRERHGVEERCARAYEAARAVGDALRTAVRKYAGDMPIAFVSDADAAAGFSSSTFSFNLPPRPGSDARERAALAQTFVDFLCGGNHAPELFKPCVSFGQDNGLAYCTVPATSTQGAIRAEDKGKQAIGGVQMVRLSFSPGCDVEKVSAAVEDAVAKVYNASR